MLHSVEILPIAKEFQIQISSSVFNPAGEVVNKVATIWHAAITKPDSGLFDNPILCVTTVREAEAICSIVPYRFFYAQRQSAELKDILQLRPLAVSGITTQGGVIYFGRRSNTVTQYPRLIELVPSGSLSAGCMVNGLIDFRLQLKEELFEELGFNDLSVHDIEPLFLTFDYQELTYDIYCRITLKSDATRSCLSTSTSEYEELFLIDSSKLAHFVNTEADRLVPTTRAVLQYKLQHLHSST